MDERIAFEQVVAKSCGLDVHKDTVVATVSGREIREKRERFRPLRAL